MPHPPTAGSPDRPHRCGTGFLLPHNAAGQNISPDQARNALENGVFLSVRVSAQDRSTDHSKHSFRRCESNRFLLVQPYFLVIVKIT